MFAASDCFIGNGSKLIRYIQTGLPNVQDLPAQANAQPLLERKIGKQIELT
jgi:hypothetical protein